MSTETRPVAPLHPLAYDELPRDSDVRREFRDGGLTITVPAGDPPPGVRRAAAQSTLVSSAAACGVCLLLGLCVAGPLLDLNRLDRSLRLSAAAVFGVFCVGVFLLAWKVRHEARMDVISGARRQATVLHARGGRLLVETSGPYGRASYDLSREQIEGLHFAREAGHEDWGKGNRVPCLKLSREGGAPLTILVGRDEGELRWVAAALAQTLGVPGA